MRPIGRQRARTTPRRHLRTSSAGSRTAGRRWGWCAAVLVRLGQAGIVAVQAAPEIAGAQNTSCSRGPCPPRTRRCRSRATALGSSTAGSVNAGSVVMPFARIGDDVASAAGRGRRKPVSSMAEVNLLVDVAGADRQLAGLIWCSMPGGRFPAGASASGASWNRVLDRRTGAGDRSGRRDQRARGRREGGPAGHRRERRAS